MRRRRLLTLVSGSTLLSGCSGLMGGETPTAPSSEPPSPTTSPSPPPTQSPPPSPEPCSALSETSVPTQTGTPTTTTSETSTPTTATTETATGDPMRTVELGYADPPPIAYDLDLQVSLSRPEITTDRTALVHVGLKNLAAAERTVQIGSFVPFSAYDSVDEDPGLALLPATRGTERESDDCWNVTGDVI